MMIWLMWKIRFIREIYLEEIDHIRRDCQVDNKKKILMLGNSHLVIFGFRGELISRMVMDGYEVVVSFPNSVFGEGEATCKQYGCRFIETKMERRKTNLVQELSLIIQYIRLIRDERPDVVLAYTVKCNTYGGIVCRITNTPFIANITGIGKALAEGGKLQKIAVVLYKLALKRADMVFFQNTSDREFFMGKGIHFEKSVILPGSGVNLQKYLPLEYPATEPIIFTYVARVMKAKGIEQFLDAARTLKGKAKFHICGYCEEKEYKSIIEKEQADGTVVYHGMVNNIIDYERVSHCIVLPTFHPEGISNVLLEAAALARPIITTNRPGCRETVIDTVTGLLVKERDSQDLIEKMKQFLSMSYENRRQMGIQGRKRIEREFDRQIVVDEYIKAIRIINNR